ncbi:MAG: hypothetical protein WKG07_41050 [Hymenobacter sp.]
MHGGWARGTGEMVGNVAYGPSPSLLVPGKRGSAIFPLLPQGRKATGSNLPEAVMCWRAAPTSGAPSTPGRPGRRRSTRCTSGKPAA